MSKEIAQTVGKKKFGLLIVLLAALAVLATLGSHWKHVKAVTAVPDGTVMTAGLALPAVPAEAVPADSYNPELARAAIGQPISATGGTGHTNSAPEVVTTSPGQDGNTLAPSASTASSSGCTANCPDASGVNYTLQFSDGAFLCGFVCGFSVIEPNGRTPTIYIVFYLLDHPKGWVVPSAELPKLKERLAATGTTGRLLSASHGANAVAVPGGSTSSIRPSEAKVIPKAGTVGLTGFILLAAIVLIPLGIWYRPRAVPDAYQGLYDSGSSPSGRGWIRKRFEPRIRTLVSLASGRFPAKGRDAHNKRE